MSIYAFAIDNFSRSEEEVDALMRLGKDRLAELCEHGWVLLSLGWRRGGEQRELCADGK